MFLNNSSILSAVILIVHTPLTPSTQHSTNIARKVHSVTLLRNTMADIRKRRLLHDRSRAAKAVRTQTQTHTRHKGVKGLMGTKSRGTETQPPHQSWMNFIFRKR